MSPRENLDFGRQGEEVAALFLKDKGYQILYRNYKSWLGEIDIIAREANTVCFVEVKTRHSERFGLPKEAVTVHKQKQISKTALGFLKENNLLHNKARFDVVSIVYRDGIPKADLIRDAFELSGRFLY